jgi:Lipoprotein LpqB beta-propeller domain/Sporulation and spore germination
MSRRIPGGPRLAAVVAAALLAAGCSGFPDRGPVLPGRRVDSAGKGLQSFAAPPVPGASPTAIVEGFVRAGEDVHEDHKVAREFLASPQTPWQPDAGVVVLTKAPQVTLLRPRVATEPPRPGEPATVRVAGQVVAHVDGRGLMTLPTAHGTGVQAPAFDVQYHLVADEHGQWRIDRIPSGAGLVLTDEQFLSTFRPIPLYFADATRRWLVPDLRWFPDLDAVDPTPTAMRVVGALLRGPAPWLGPPGDQRAVTTGTVPRTQLTPVGGVRIEGDVVHVDLEKTIRNASSEQRLLLHAQLTATLRNIVSASQIVLTAGQAAFEVPTGDGPRLWTRSSTLTTGQQGRADGVGQPRQDQQSPATDQRPLCLDQRNRVGELDTSQAKPACQERKDLALFARRDLTLATADAAGRLVAGVVAGGTAVVAAPAFASPPAVPRQVLTGPGLTAPDIDAQGWIWSATSDGKVLAGRLGNRQQQVDAPWLDGAVVRAVRISPEGARALLLLARGRGTEAVVTGVVRRGDGTPVGFSAVTPLRVLGDLTRAVDGAWSDGRDVVVLGSRTADAHLYVLQAQVGGESGQPLFGSPVPEKATGLAVSSPLDVYVVSSPVDVYVRTSDGRSAASVLGEWKPLEIRGLTLPN